MPKPPPNPEIVQQARELVAAGCSQAEAGRVLGVNAMTISRWLKKPALVPAVAAEKPVSTPPPAPAPALPSLPAHMLAPVGPALVPVNVDDPILLVKQLIREQHAQIHADKAAGARGTSVSSAVATLEKLTKTLKQLEESDRKSSDGVTVTSAEYARIDASLDERIRANVARHALRCADCNRALSVFWGTGLTEAELDADPAAEPVIAEAGA